MTVNLLRVVNEYSAWPDGTLQCTMKSENKQCMFKQFRFVIRGNFRQYFLIAGLQLSIPRGVDLSKYHLSSVDVRLASIVYRQSSIYQFIFILHCHVYVGDWSTVAACWQHTCLVLRWGVVTSLLQSVTPAGTLHRALLLARGCSWRLDVVCHPSLSSSTRGVTAVTLPLRGPVSCRCCVTGSTSALSPVSSCGWATI